MPEGEGPGRTEHHPGHGGQRHTVHLPQGRGQGRLVPGRAGGGVPDLSLHGDPRLCEQVRPGDFQTKQPTQEEEQDALLRLPTAELQVLYGRHSITIIAISQLYTTLI